MKPLDTDEEMAVIKQKIMSGLGVTEDQMKGFIADLDRVTCRVICRECTQNKLFLLLRFNERLKELLIDTISRFENAIKLLAEAPEESAPEGVAALDTTLNNLGVASVDARRSAGHWRVTLYGFTNAFTNAIGRDDTVLSFGEGSLMEALTNAVKALPVPTVPTGG